MPRLKRFTLINHKGMQVELDDFGARILSIKVPGRDGKRLETTLNHGNDIDIINDKFYMGASVGRTCNRISNG
jgi:aldose 1-epimerase